MKKTIFLSLILSGFFVLVKAENKAVETKITKATVYLNGAQVQRTGAASIPVGKTTLVVENLPSNIDPNSIQASGKGSYTILAVNYKNRNYNTKEVPQKVAELQKEIRAVEDSISYLDNVLEALVEEKNMILQNNKVDYSKLGFATEDLEDLSDFFRNRITAILDLSVKTKIQKRILGEQRTKLQEEVNEILKIWRTLTGKIELEIYAKAATKAAFEVEYYVNNAGWAPVYNIKSNSLSEPVDMNYNAKVYQNTGEDWENVLLTLSTTNPRLNNNKPIVYPWRIDFINPNQFRGYDVEAVQAMPGRVNKLAQSDEAAMEPAGTAANFTTVAQNITSVAFDISLPYSIPSTGEPQLVNIQNLKLNSTYEYYAAPKLAQSACLIAKATGWEDKNLLPGEANIYLQNTFVGKSFINPNATTNELDLSFGVDNQVVVTRERIKNFCSTSFLGSNKKEAIGYEIAVRNTKSVPIKIKIQDQIPTSGNEDISVDVEELSDADLNKDTGILTWEKSVNPSSTDKVQIKFEVKFPKDKFVNL